MRYRIYTPLVWIIINPDEELFRVLKMEHELDTFYKVYNFLYPKTLGEFILYCERFGIELPLRSSNDEKRL